jgi:hypothetical protein
MFFYLFGLYTNNLKLHENIIIFDHFGNNRGLVLTREVLELAA